MAISTSETGRPVDPRDVDPRASTDAAPAASSLRERPDASALFTLLKPDLESCYATGRLAVPTMLEGKLTLNAAIDARGEAVCVVPTEDSGLTQEVEDCMSERLAARSFGAGRATTMAVPVVVRAGAVRLGDETAHANVVESVETRNMPDAFDAIESVEPALRACARGIDRTGPRSIIVAARVGANGRARCALATSGAGTVPPAAAACLVNAFLEASFPPPKRGSGLVLVPISLAR